MKKFVPKQALLDIANNRIKSRPGFMEGMHIEEAEMNGHFLIMYGEHFLTADGSATENTASAIDFYKKFANEFSNEYGLLI